jgi:hypothetical protein
MVSAAIQNKRQLAAGGLGLEPFPGCGESVAEMMPLESEVASKRCREMVGTRSRLIRLSASDGHYAVQRL